MRRGVIGVLVFTVAMLSLSSNFPPLNAQELPLELRWSTTCPHSIWKARLTDLDEDGQKEFAYTSGTWNVRNYLRTYQITPDELVLTVDHLLPRPDGLNAHREFDLKDINDDGEFDMLVGYGFRLYILYGPQFTVGNYYQFRDMGFGFWIGSVDIKLNPDGPSVVVCSGRDNFSHTYYTILNSGQSLTLPELERTAYISNAAKHSWEGIDNFSGRTIYLFSKYYCWYSMPYPWEDHTIYGFTVTDEALTTVDQVIWDKWESTHYETPLCFAGQLDTDSEIEFIMSHELTLRCYDLREGDLELKWYRENTADDYLSALDVTGDGIEEAIVANSEGQIWAIEGEYGNTIAAGSIGHHVSDMFFTQHQETGRNLLICYENGDQPVLYLYEIGTLTGIDDDKSQQSKPKDFILKQNYPNPFNAQTQIEYFLNRDGETSLEIFDLAGSLVATLQEGRKQAGKHAVEWNGEGFASGIYFYRLTSGESTQTKKMILLK